MVPRSNDQPTDTELTGSASKNPGSPSEAEAAGEPGSSPIPPRSPGEQGGAGVPPAAPIPLWPPPPPHEMPGGQWHEMPGGQWPPPEGLTQAPGPYDNGSAVRTQNRRRVAPLDALGRPLASWAKRVLAILVDFLLLSLLLSWFGHAVFPNLLSSSSATYSSVPQSQALSFLGVSFLVWVGYLSLLASSRRGQTLGMMLYGIAVRDVEGGSVSVGRATIRSVILILASGFLIDAFWPLWDPRRQALHDKPARTVVVDVRLAALLEQLPPGVR